MPDPIDSAMSAYGETVPGGLTRASGRSSRSAPASQRLSRATCFRAIATIAIVATHCLSVFDWSASPAVGRALRFALANSSVLFIFLSGYLFDRRSLNVAIAPYLAGKLKRVVLPYLVVSLPALVLFTFVLHREGLRTGFYDQPDWQQVVEFLLTGAHLTPLWFIPTLLVLYAAAPLHQRLFRRPQAFWLLPLLFVIPAVTTRVSDPVMNAVHFLPVWVLGMGANRFRHQVRSLLATRGLMLLLLGAVAACLAIELLMAAGTHTFPSYIGKCLLSIALFEGLRPPGGGVGAALAEVGSLGTPIFFLHSYVVSAGKLLELRMVGHLPDGSVPSLAAAAAAALLATMLITYALRRMLGRGPSRWLVGA